MQHSRLKFRLMEAATSPMRFLARTLYRPASVSTTSSKSNTTWYVWAVADVSWQRNVVRPSAVSSTSLRYHSMSGLGEASSWHSKISRLPSSSCRSCGFCVKLGANSSATPIVSAFGGFQTTAIWPARRSAAARWRTMRCVCARDECAGRRRRVGVSARQKGLGAAHNDASMRLWSTGCWVGFSRFVRGRIGVRSTFVLYGDGNLCVTALILRVARNVWKQKWRTSGWIYGNKRPSWFFGLLNVKYMIGLFAEASESASIGLMDEMTEYLSALLKPNNAWK